MTETATYRYQPEMWVPGAVEGMGSYSYLWHDQGGKYMGTTPIFDDLDAAIDWLKEHNVSTGMVQRLACYPATKKPVKPIDSYNYGAQSLYERDLANYERGYWTVTAGIAWRTSTSAPTTILCQITTRDQEYRDGQLLIEVPGAFETVMAAGELVTEENEGGIACFQHC